MAISKIDRNSIICGHCKWIKSVGGDWQCNNPDSESYIQTVSYPTDGCGSFERFDKMQSPQKRPVPCELLRRVQEFIDAEWTEPVIYADIDFYASKSFSFEGGGSSSFGGSFDDIIGPLGQTFQEKLLAMIDAKGLKDAEVYSKANIDRRLFSKIRSNKNYKPSKPTALAFAIALGLNLDETTDLLQRAGLALSPSSKADLIVKYCIINEIYNILDVNAILYEYDQPLLGY